MSISVEQIVWIAGVTVGAFVLMALAYSYVKYERLMQHAGSASAGDGPLSLREAFLLHAARRLAPGGSVIGAFCTVLIEPADPGAVPADRIEEVLRAVLRRTDDVRRLPDGVIGIVLDVELRHLDRVLARLKAALDGGLVRPGLAPLHLAVRAGVSRFPGDGESVSTLLAVAEDALREARSCAVGTWKTAASGADGTVAAEDDDPTDLALLDPLTGILRPDKMGSAARKFIARSRRFGRPVSVVYIDVDRLHEINERFGVPVGDEVLKRIGSLLQKQVRESDLIGRLVSDDFLALVEAAPAAAAAAAERLIAQIQNETIPAGLAQVHFTVCIGIAGYPDHGAAPQALLDAAELALDAARQRGQNQWRVYDPSLRTAPRRRRSEDDVF